MIGKHFQNKCHLKWLKVENGMMPITLLTYQAQSILRKIENHQNNNPILIYSKALSKDNKQLNEKEESNHNKESLNQEVSQNYNHNH